MYPLQLAHVRQREVFKQITDRMATAGVSGYKVQPVVLRSFARTSVSERSLRFLPTASDGNSVIQELEYLLPNGRVALVYAMAFGVAGVPIVSSVEQNANVKYASNPYNTAVVPAASTSSALAMFNGFTKFKTNEVDRLSKVATTMFFGESTEMVTNSLKPILLPAAYTVVGGETNEITVSIPSTGSTAAILGDATTKLYGVIELYGFEIIAGSDQRAAIANALNS